MEQLELVLVDPNIYPTEEIIFSYLGRTKSYWTLIFDFIETNYSDFNKEWRYYKDGKSWLLKVTRKKKTICWISVIHKSFRMTFYFSDKAEQTIMESTISEELKSKFQEGKHYGKIRGLTIIFKNKKDVEYAKILIDIKLKIK